MCGIAGFVGTGSEQNLLAMSEALIHRGPDGLGTHVDREHHVFLAHRRLAILDLPGGVQPMWNEDAQICVIFNGEIYNHLYLRKELLASGHVFRSDHSDTEVLVHGYEQWGEALPQKLNGMFAFAIYDRPRQRLFFARDRFGKKPLYYTSRDGYFAFASELRALLVHPSTDRTVSDKALQKYFAYGFIPAPHSLYRHIAKLPGGHSMRLDVASGRVTLSRYWEFRIEPPSATLPSDDVLGEELRELLSQAVKRRLISDVPLGLFLSGGIDSTAVLAFATRHIPAELTNTFSIGFREASFDESPHARRAATLFGSRHHHDVLDLGNAVELVPSVLSRLDEPMSDSSILPTYLLSRFAREHVTVALGGDGGDELFAGYDPFRALKAAQYYQKVVSGKLHGAVRRLADLLPPSERNMSLEFKIKRTLRAFAFPEAMWNPIWLGPLEPREIEELFEQPVRVEELFAEAIDAWNRSSAEDIVDLTLEFYSRFYLQDDILTKIDRASMMVSLEVRAPFLDNDVVEFARRLPNRYKYRRGQTKHLLKKALEPLIPADILHRRKKGFGVPLARWLKHWHEPGALAGEVGLNVPWVKRQWDAHRQGRADQRMFLWSWVVLQSHFAAAPA